MSQNTIAQNKLKIIRMNRILIRLIVHLISKLYTKCKVRYIYKSLRKVRESYYGTLIHKRYLYFLIATVGKIDLDQKQNRRKELLKYLIIFIQLNHHTILQIMSRTAPRGASPSFDYLSTPTTTTTTRRTTTPTTNDQRSLGQNHNYGIVHTTKQDLMTYPKNTKTTPIGCTPNYTQHDVACIQHGPTTTNSPYVLVVALKCNPLWTTPIIKLLI